MNLAAAIPMIPTGNELTALLVVVSFSGGLNVFSSRSNSLATKFPFSI